MKKIKKNQPLPVQEPEGINLKQLYFSLNKYKYRILICGILGAGLAFVYNSYFPQKYSVLTTVLVKTDNSQATLNSIHQEIPNDKNVSDVQDQVGVLSSYVLNLQTLENLKWNVSWAEKDIIINRDLYKDAPFKVDTVSKSLQIRDVPIEIKAINDSKYLVTCNQVNEVMGIKHKIKFEQEGKFGKPFKNNYFDFTLSKMPGSFADLNTTYVLIFNDLTSLAKSYQDLLKISSGDDGSDLINIELVSRQPNRAIDYLNELDKVYIKFGLTEKNRRAANTVRFINNQISGIADSLQESGNSVSDFKSSNNVIDINQQSTSIVNDLSKIQSEIAGQKMQLEYYSNLRRYISNAEAIKSMVAPSVVGVTDATLNSLVAKLTDLFHQREVLSYTAQDSSPQMISLDEEIKYTQNALTENLTNLISNTRVQLHNLDRQEAGVNSSRSAIPKTEQNLNKVKRKFDFNSDLYSYLLQKRSEAQIAQASRDPDAQIIDEAGFGTATLKGFNHSINLIVGFLIGLFVPLIYFIVAAFFKNRLKYVNDIKVQLRPSIIGNILHNKFDTELPVLVYPHAEITESFRNLRINSQYLLQGLKHKVISINSSIAGEGKTFVSTNFAAIIAISNKAVLLVDADLRQPRTHEILKCSNEIGLSDYLEGSATLSEVLQPTKVKGLSVVTSGHKPDYPSELLDSDRLPLFIAEAKEHYEYIIFNNSPLKIVKDGMMVVPHSDLNIFLLRMNKSSVNELDYINQLLQEKIIKNVTVALNNVTSESYAVIEKNDHGYYNDNTMLKLN